MPFVTTALVAGGIAAAGGLASSAIKANAAGKAAGAQASAAEQARALVEANQKKAQDFQQAEWTGQQQREQPYQDLGSTSANNLAALLQKGFHAPTLAEAEQTPGFQFNLEQGTAALDKSAAARGNLFSGTQGTALLGYGQGLAETTYQQDYKNALDAYMTNYQSLLGGTDVGLSSTGQLGTFGQAAAGNMANIDLTGAQLQASQINNAAAARASGYVNSANAWGSGIQGLANWGSTIPGQLYPKHAPAG